MKSVLFLICFGIPFITFGSGLDDYRVRSFGHILFIRHALAPGFGDPDHFQLRRCDTQRNLDEQGRNQARNLGKLLKNSGIPFDKIYSSQWCRCLETAELLNLGPVIEEPGLNSFFQGIVNQEETLTNKAAGENEGNPNCRRTGDHGHPLRHHQCHHGKSSFQRWWSGL